MHQHDCTSTRYYQTVAAFLTKLGIRTVDRAVFGAADTGNLGRFSGNLGRFSGNLGRFSGNLGRFSGNLGRFSGNLGRFSGNLGRFSGNLGRFSGNLGRFSGNLGRFVVCGGIFSQKYDVAYCLNVGPRHAYGLPVVRLYQQYGQE